MIRPYSLLLMLALTFAAGTAVPTQAAPPADPDYETIVSAPHSAVSLPAAPGEPAGFAVSPLVISEKVAQPRLRRRFVMRDGTVLVGQVLAFDGQMYALRLPHSTLLVRKDLFTSIGPVTVPVSKHQAAHAAAGPRA